MATKRKALKFGAHGSRTSFRNCLSNTDEAQSRVGFCISKALDDCPAEHYEELRELLVRSQALSEDVKKFLAKFPPTES